MTPAEADPARRIVALGDSFTAGAVGEEGMRTWVHTVLDALARQDARWRLELLAVADTPSTAMADAQLPAVAPGAALATLTCGAADVLRESSPDLPAHERALDTLLPALSARAEGVLVLTYPRFAPLLPWRPRSKARVERGMEIVNAAVRRAAARHGVLCVDLEAGEVNPDMIGPDGIHPTVEGHVPIGEVVVEALRDARPDWVAPAPELVP